MIFVFVHYTTPFYKYMYSNIEYILLYKRDI